MTDTETAAFANFIAAFEAAWNGGDFFQVRDLWSPDVAEPWHFPEELDHPVIGWDALEAYLAEAQHIIERFRVQVSDPAIKPVPGGGDLRIFRFRMSWKALLRGDSEAVGADVRVSGLLAPFEGELRLVHYMEAGPAALPFMRAAYRQRAAELGPFD